MISLCFSCVSCFALEALKVAKKTLLPRMKGFGCFELAAGGEGGGI